MHAVLLFIFGTLAIVNPASSCSVDDLPRSIDGPIGSVPDEYADWFSGRGYDFDVSAYRELPPEVLRADLDYLKQAVDLVGGVNAAKRDAYRLLNVDRRAPRQPLESHPGAFRSGGIYPFDVWVEEAGEEPVPIQLLPDPSVVRRHLLRPEHDEVTAVEHLIEAGAPYSRSILFQPGPLSEDPQYPRHPSQPYSFSSLDLGKIVGRNADLAEPLQQLRASEPEGAVVLATLTSVALSDAIYLVEVRDRERRDVHIAYPIASGHSGFRPPAALRDTVAPFADRVNSAHDALVNGHTTAIAPRPVGQAEPAWAMPWFPEDIVAYETRTSEDPPIVVLRKDRSWEPFREDYIIDSDLRFAGNAEHPARRIAMFMSIEPESLLRVVAALHNADADGLEALREKAQKLERFRGRQVEQNAGEAQ